MEDLKRGRLQIVVTTDQAARGLELAGVAHVVNFDVPPSPEDYVHRIGRAGRPDAQGDAFTLMAPEEQRHLAGIERFVGRAVPRVLLPDFNYGLKPNQLASRPRWTSPNAKIEPSTPPAPTAAFRTPTPAFPVSSRSIATTTAKIDNVRNCRFR